MRIGVISEGRADFAVIRNIIKGALNLDAADVDSIRPDLQNDETSLNVPGQRTFSNWEIVRQECEDGTSIKAYLDSNVQGTRLVVVHIDTAECDRKGFDVPRPARNGSNYAEECHAAVVESLRTLIGTRCSDFLEYIVEAVAVEETDAWLIPLYESSGGPKGHDTGLFNNPKERLNRVLKKTNSLTDNERTMLLRNRNELEKYHHLSKPLRKNKKLREVMKCSMSLAYFADSLCNIHRAA